MGRHQTLLKAGMAWEIQAEKSTAEATASGACRNEGLAAAEKRRACKLGMNLSPLHDHFPLSFGNPATAVLPRSPLLHDSAALIVQICC